jgi:radical SAM-linked protein
MRGCPVGCRFCQAGYAYRPTRQRDPEQVRDTAIRSVRATGYDQFSLSSLNSGEYAAIQPVMIDLMKRFEPERVSLSLSSLHASTITPELAAHLRKVRKSGFTIAPEAGTQRLRDVINKNLDDEQILSACRLAFEAGWHQIKLYFMIGLPTETDADIDGIVDLAHDILKLARRTAGGGRRPEITLSASSFVPKPGTPFQWVAMDRGEELRRKQERIAGRIRRGIRFKRHHRETSFLEGTFSRGDRALCGVLEGAWRNGARFDGWVELHDGQAWEDAFRSEEVDPSFYAHRPLDRDGRLPWDVVDSLINRRWLASEYERALKGEGLGICGPDACHGCAPFAGECVDGVVARSAEKRLAPSPPRPDPGPPPEKLRYRVRFNKQGLLRFLGHLDLAKLVIRAFRRARITLAYSQGFNPKPKVAFGPALPVGISSEAEYADFESYDLLDTRETLERINRVLPAGIRFDALSAIRQDQAALCDAARAARYRVHTGGAFDLEAGLASFEARSDVRVSRRKKNGKLQQFELARELLGLEMLDGGAFRMTLALGGGASIRPGEVLQAMFGESSTEFRTVREELLVDWKGRLVNPLLAASAGSASHV